MVCMLVTASAVKQMLSKYPKTPWWINASQVADYCGIEHDNGLHKQTILSSRAKPKIGCGFLRERGIGRHQTDYGCIRETFYRFCVSANDANNTASNTRDLVAAVMSFFQPGSNSKRECNRVMCGGRIGTNFFRDLTQRILSNAKFVSVLFADRPCEFIAEIEQIIKACENNRVDSRAQHLVRDQLIKMIKCGALVCPENGVGSPPRHDTALSKSLPSKRARCLSPLKSVHPTTPVRKQSKKSLDRFTPKSTTEQIPPLRVADCLSWSSTFAECIVANDVVQNLDNYVGYSQMSPKLRDSAIRHRLTGLWQSMNSPIPSPRAKPGGVIMIAKNNTPTFDTSKVLVLTLQLNDKHTNCKMRTRLIQSLTRFRRKFYDDLPVSALQPRLDQWDSLSVHDYCVMMAKCAKPVVTIARDHLARRAKQQKRATEVVPETLEQIGQHLIRTRFESFVGPNGKRILPDHVAAALKMISAECGVSDINLNLVVAYVCVYLLGVPPPINALFHVTAVTPKWRRIQMAETRLAAAEFNEYFTKNPHAKFYIYTDDTGNKHATFVAYPTADGIKRLLLSVSAPLGGTDEAHAILNLEHLLEAGFPLARFNGGCTDHKAKSEIRKTFVKVMQKAGIVVDEHIHMWYGDWFHKISLVSEYVSKTICPDKGIGECGHKQVAYLLRSLWLRGTKFDDKRITSQYASFVMGGDGWWCNLPPMMQDQRWGMTATACKWCYDLYTLQIPGSGKSFLIEFAKYMVKQTSGWQSEGWVEVATWITMPEIRVGLLVEMELWTRWAEPQFHFARRHFQGMDGLPGHGLRDVVKYQHEHVRPLWAKARMDCSFLFPLAAQEVNSIPDPVLKAEVQQLLQEATNAGADEKDELFSCHYESWMLLLWLWHPTYTASAARAFAHLLQIAGCPPPGDDTQDQMFRDLFNAEADAVLAHWKSWGTGCAFDDEIKQMCDCDVTTTDQMMSTLYPKYDKLLKDVVDSLAITDVICEITFSHSKATFRQNMSDTRHDNDLQWVHNVLYKMRKARQARENKLRHDKGLTRKIGKVSATKMRPQTCVFAAEQFVLHQQRYTPELMEKLKVPSSTKLRRSKKLRLRCIEQKKSKRSVEMLQAANSRRRPITDEQFDALVIKNRAKNVNHKKWQEELAMKAAYETNDGKIRATIKCLLSEAHWRSSRFGGVNKFRQDLRMTFPSYTKRLDNLLYKLRSGSLTLPIASFWTKSGLLNKSAINSKKIAEGAHGVSAYLHNIRTADFSNFSVSIQMFTGLLKEYGCGDEELSLWFLCLDSQHVVHLLWIAVRLDHGDMSTRSYRSKKTAAIRRMSEITSQCGHDISELPLMVNKGDMLISHVVGFTDLQRPQVRVFFDSAVETMVLCDTSLQVKIGDKVVIEVSNTSGGRDFLQAKLSRTIKLHPDNFSSQKPILVMRVMALLGRTDSCTGYFIPRPAARDFLMFVARLFTLAVWTVSDGACIESKIFFVHPLLFVGVGDTIPEPASMADITSRDLVPRNVVRLVPEGDATTGTDVLISSRYEGGKKDDVLMVGSELRSLLQGAALAEHAGSFISEYNDDDE